MTASELIDISSKLTSDQATKLVRSFPMDSELRQAIEQLKEIRHVGDAIALEVFLKTMMLVMCCELPD